MADGERRVSVTFYVTRSLESLSAGLSHNKTVTFLQVWYTVFVLSITKVSLDYIISECAFYTDTTEAELVSKALFILTTFMTRGKYC